MDKAVLKSSAVRQILAKGSFPELHSSQIKQGERPGVGKKILLLFYVCSIHDYLLNIAFKKSFLPLGNKVLHFLYQTN